MGSKTSQNIKVGSVTLHAYEWVHPGTRRIYWRAVYHDPETNKRKYITRADKSELVKAARSKAREIHNGALDLSSLSADEVRLCRAFLDLKPDWRDIETIRAVRSKESITMEEALNRFLEIKAANAGASPHNLYTLTKRLTPLIPDFGEMQIASVKTGDLDQWMAQADWSANTKKRVRESLITFFRWCRDQEILPDRKTEAEKMAKPIVIKGTPSTFTPEELALMLVNVREEFLPWLAISAWAGVRREEMYPAVKSKKDSLQWEDIDFERKIITIRREVSKTNERRVIPICPALASILQPLAGTGRISGKTGPSDQKNKKEDSETKRLGELVGGWRANALRHSFVSYRCALVGVATAAMEAGNSESETRRSYRDAMSEAQAKDWFSADTVRN